MTLAEQPFVGDASARMVHGHSAGAPAFVLGSSGQRPSSDVPPQVEDSLRELGLEPVVMRSELPSTTLSRLAEHATQVHAADPLLPLAVVAADLEVSAVGLLDLLDRPNAGTAVATLEPDVVAGPPGAFTILRVQREQRLVHSVGSERHTVTNPTSLAAGLLRVAPADVPEAIRLWQAAASSQVAADPEVDPFDLALLALVRGGVRVGAVPIGPYDVERGASRATGASGSAWQQRLRGASREQDGFFSTFVVRPLSRRLTAFGLAHGWRPNAVTLTSLMLGLAASVLAANDNRLAWVAAAVLLQVALVVDCVDGEIARFTRRFSALGAWLDAVGDRVKEYSMIAAVAWVSVRRDQPTWLLATTAMVLITLRHLEDYAYVDRSRASRAHLHADRLGVDASWDLGPQNARLTLPGLASKRTRLVHWVKKVLHMPIAERYLLLSLGLVTFNTHVVLWAITVAVALALLWTQGGRSAKALLHLDGFRKDASVSPMHWGHLDHQLDLGPLARQAGRVVALPFGAAAVGVLMVGAAAAVAGKSAVWLAAGLVLLGCLLLGAGCRPPLQQPMGWQGPALLWAAEAALVLAIVNPLPEAAEWCGYAYLAAIAWHRYDVVYRLRDTGRPSAPWLTAATLGVDGRLVVLSVVAALGGPVRGLLAWGALVLFVVYAVESARGWRAWVRGEAPEPSATTEAETEVAV